VLLASIPASPGPFIFQFGSFGLRWYGFLIAVGIALALWIVRREFRRRGWDPEDAYTVALWAVPAGIIGARLYHVITDWHLFADDPLRIIQIQQGGLGLPGVIAGGAVGVYIAARRCGLSFGGVADCVAPGLILAQALGRWGNYFNQELFGRPTDLPWGLHVDEAFRPYGYATYEQFHPVFLYESVLDVGIFIALGLLWRPLHERFRPGCIVGAYLILYGLVRVLMELLRSDPSNMIGPFRLNLVVAVLVLLTGALILIVADRRRPQRR
jgi:prolipoprotein diacylglyceryl transferase